MLTAGFEVEDATENVCVDHVMVGAGAADLVVPGTAVVAGTELVEAGAAWDSEVDGSAAAVEVKVASERKLALDPALRATDVLGAGASPSGCADELPTIFFVSVESELSSTLRYQNDQIRRRYVRATGR